MGARLTDAEARVLANGDFVRNPARESDSDDGFVRLAQQLNGPDIQRADD